MSLITPLRDERTLVLQLRDAISTLIEEQRLQPGDQLPTEAELTRKFQISRPALREALKLLEGALRLGRSGSSGRASDHVL
jgi:GntR family transcriptional regulator